jgi:hypothetical protein
MLGGNERLADRIERFAEMAMKALFDCCMEPRLAYLYWARKCQFDADTPLACSYIKRIAENVIMQEARNRLPPLRLPARDQPNPRTMKVRNREKPGFVITNELGKYFDRESALRSSMPTPETPLVLPASILADDEKWALISELIFDQHFRGGPKGEPDVVWQVFWAHVIQGMPHEEVALIFSRDVHWVRRRKSQLRKSIIEIIEIIKAVRKSAR